MVQLLIQKLKTDKTGCRFRHPVRLCFQKSNVFVCGCSADVENLSLRTSAHTGVAIRSPSYSILPEVHPKLKDFRLRIARRF